MSQKILSLFLPTPFLFNFFFLVFECWEEPTNRSSGGKGQTLLSYDLKKGRSFFISFFFVQFCVVLERNPIRDCGDLGLIKSLMHDEEHLHF